MNKQGIKIVRIAMIAGLLASNSQMPAAGSPTDEDTTPVTQCDNLPVTASIEVFSNAQTDAVCKEMLRILEGVTVTDIRTFFESRLPPVC
jgi:hypothetical protein